jgi:hypothetical protein
VRQSKATHRRVDPKRDATPRHHPPEEPEREEAEMRPSSERRRTSRRAHRRARFWQRSWPTARSGHEHPAAAGAAGRTSFASEGVEFHGRHPELERPRQAGSARRSFSAQHAVRFQRSTQRITDAGPHVTRPNVDAARTKECRLVGYGRTIDFQLAKGPVRGRQGG